MIKTRLYNPYTADGKTTFPDRQKSGVYLIYKDENLRYVGFSANDLYKTMYRHFQKWTDFTQKRVIYTNLKGIKVRVIYCPPMQAANLERALIIKYSPSDNPQKLLNLKMEKGEVNAFQKYIALNTIPIEDVPY